MSRTLVGMTTLSAALAFPGAALAVVIGLGTAAFLLAAAELARDGGMADLRLEEAT